MEASVNTIKPNGYNVRKGSKETTSVALESLRSVDEEHAFAMFDRMRATHKPQKSKKKDCPDWDYTNYPFYNYLLTYQRGRYLILYINDERAKRGLLPLVEKDRRYIPGPDRYYPGPKLIPYLNSELAIRGESPYIPGLDLPNQH